MKKYIYKTFVFFFACTSLTFSLTACESDEDNKIAGAQDCLNDLNDSSPTSAAQVCLAMVSDVDTEQANVIKCSASFFIGGITSSDIESVMDDYENAPTNQKEAVLVTGLVQSPAAQADDTYSYCEKSGIPGLVYVSAVSRMGTILDAATGGGAPDAIIDSCLPGGGGTCTAGDLQAIGEMVPVLSDLYCVGDNATSQICTDLESAINGETDPAVIAENLLNFFNF